MKRPSLIAKKRKKYPFYEEKNLIGLTPAFTVSEEKNLSKCSSRQMQNMTTSIQFNFFSLFDFETKIEPTLKTLVRHKKEKKFKTILKRERGGVRNKRERKIERGER
jgi:hypothetical protein